MGLETQKLSSLWKDQALVAVNVAVMHSFQVQIVSFVNLVVTFFGELLITFADKIYFISDLSS